MPPESAPRLEAALKTGGGEFFPIGKMTAEGGLKITTADGTLRDLRVKGYDHFKKTRDVP